MAERFAVLADQAGQRLDAWLCGRLDGMSRARAVDHIAHGHVRLVEGPRTAHLRPSLLVARAMVFEIEVQPRPAPSAAAEAIDLSVVYEDADVVVVDKPAGLVVHPAAGHLSGTLVNALMHHLPDLEGVGDPLRPGLVHRIDKDTSGLLVAAKHERALRRLGADFAAHRLERRYAAIALGQLSRDTLTLRTLHGRHPTDRRRFSGRVGEGKPAVTHLTVIARSPLTTLVVATLQTGRTHQIRMHLAELGHPIAADALYGGARPHPRTDRTRADAQALGQLSRQALHAYALAFRQPTTGAPLRFELGWPADLAPLARALYGDAARLPGLDEAVHRGE